MTDAVVNAPSDDPERLVWIMNTEHFTAYRRFLRDEMGLADDASESFGITIEIGEPSNGEPFELRLRATH